MESGVYVLIGYAPIGLIDSVFHYIFESQVNGFVAASPAHRPCLQDIGANQHLLMVIYDVSSTQ